MIFPEAIQPYLIIAVLLVAMYLFISGKWRFDIVAMMALGLSIALGAVPYSQVFSGLSNAAVITVACVMIISSTISRTGVLDSIVQRIGHLTKNPLLHLIILTFIAAIISGFMNNVGALALMMPIAMQISHENNRSPAFILMPLAFGSALGGLTTLIGTPPNLLISAYRQEYTGHPFTMFSFSHVGAPLALICVTFIVLVGWRLIPTHRKGTKRSEDLYQVHEYITEIIIPEKSPVVDTTIAQFEKLITADFVTLGLIRDKKKKLMLQRNQKLKANDILIVEISTEDLEDLLRTGKLELAADATFTPELLKSDDISMIEAVIPQGSQADGRSAQALQLRTRFHINLLAIARQGKSFKQRINQTALKAGDVVLLQGEGNLLRENAIQLGLLPLDERDIRAVAGFKAYLPLLIFFVAILTAAFQFFPVAIAFGGAVLAMILTKSLPIRKIYSSIDWPIIMLLAAMIPVGNALQTTGGTRLISHLFVMLANHLPPALIIGGLLFVTMILSDFMNNAATTVVMAPIGVAIAHALKLNIDPFLMTVSVGASCAFLTPVGHQNNTLVMGPGGYRFGDYMRLGLPIDLIVLFVGTPLILWAWPLK